MQSYLEHIYSGESLSFEQSKSLFSEVLSQNTAVLSKEQITALLIALKTKGETIEEIAGAAAAMREQAQEFPEFGAMTSDCCGTGGDGLNTINVSTLVGIVGSYFGVPMVKHGNRSVSSQSGSADLMEQLGIAIDVSPKRSQEILAETNFSFLFAPAYHQGMKPLMPIRQALKTRTIFNLIGPLANPAYPEIQLLGVYDKNFCKPFAQILNLLGTKKALVVHGSGLDEIAAHGETYGVLLENGELKEINLSPEDFGAERHDLSAIQVDSLDDNTAAALAVIDGSAPQAHLDMVAINCSALLVLNDKATDFKAGYSMAMDALKSGELANHLQKIKVSSHG